MNPLALVALGLVVFAIPAFAQQAAAPPSARSETVPRAVFTSGVVDREPLDQVTLLTNDVHRVYFYSELNNLEGHTITHRWKRAGEIKAEVAFDVQGPRWRVWSSKQFHPSWTGEWTVSVVDGSGAILARATLNYRDKP